MQKKNVDRTEKFLKVLMILLGIQVVLRIFRYRIRKRKEKKNKDLKVKEYSSFMESRKIEEKETLNGIFVTVCMSGLKLDLSEVSIKDEMFLEIKALMSGVVIQVPKGVNVKFEGKVVGADIANQVPKYLDKKAPTLYIVGKAVMSAVEIKVVP